MVRLRVSLAALGCAGASLVVGACGDAGERPAAQRGSTSPPASSPTAKTPTLEAASGAARNGSRARLEPLLEGDAIVHVAAGRDLVAASVGDLRGSRLFVGRPTPAGPLRLKRASGAGVLPSWASIRVGIDAGGEPVVSYPTCADDRFVSCEPRLWSSRTRRETTVAGFDRAGGTTEVAVDRGNAALVGTTDPNATTDDLLAGKPYRSSVWVKHAAAPARELAVSSPEAISLHGDTLGTISADEDAAANAGVCGVDRADLWRIDRPDDAPREIGTVVCGLGGSRMVSLDLGRTIARVMVTANGEDGHPELLVHDGETGTTSRRPLGADVADVAWFSATQGIAVGPASDPCTTGLYDAGPGDQPPLNTCVLSRLTRTSGVR